MGQAETFDHTADLGLRLRATDLADLFQTAAEALFDVMIANREDVRQVESERVSLASDTPESLLIDWLNELIYLVEAEHRIFGGFEVRVAEDGRSLEATIRGEPLDSSRHVLDHEVKAATYHGARLDRVGPGYLAELILDI
ncbi:archease [Aquisphaera insulae]|uniref:archease n=1 Tax=Aquisphaera insulae TaxID=2712864 RepID=UPI0013EAB029|nr:archease [Aquisphaera insulae]